MGCWYMDIKELQEYLKPLKKLLEIVIFVYVINYYDMCCINFIIKLLLLKNLIIGIEYDAIFNIDTEQLVYIFFKIIISIYEVLDKIISNRDKLFILKF
ncbi:uncharacterized protein Bfra_002314 [Botrytis fragariae]|uniref:Uncharacterized protein n=1 Tax=Botrytis fragariae TaxID=1964551 RepID=A0A8H6AY31_9HELO|nr:uncharacterized protein Bfra_002314 [Botrytis fragariae]KAF5875918.1 hypothetical protein Bfra_002314 [Botrytis fragariae]